MSRISLLCRRGAVPALAAALALVLAACSGGGSNAPTLQLQILQTARATLAARRGSAQPARPPVTRAVLDTLEGTYLEVTLERGNRLAYLSVNAERRDAQPGKITVWRSDDNVTLAMRNGMLIATRGLGGDMVSSAVQVSGDAPGPSGGGEKIHYIRDLDNKERRLVLACTLADLGPETIVIVERAHPTRHLRERCVAGAADGGGAVTNDYWVDSRRGLVWQSRQWAGPHIGYLRTRQLTN